MFKNLRTSTKLFILCAAFVISVGVSVGAVVMEKRIAIDFARKELAGSRYVATLREVCVAILAFRARGEARDRLRASGEAILGKLATAEAEAGAGLQTSELAQALAAALRELWASAPEGGEIDARVLDALEKVRKLAQRVGDDSNLALDPDLDSYYVQSIVVRLMPTFVGQLSQLQQSIEASIEPGSPASLREVRLPILASLLRSTAGEIENSIAAAHRGNRDGSLGRRVAGEIAAMLSSMNAYLGVLSVSAAAPDASDGLPYDRYHAGTVERAIGAWAGAQAELDRLLQRRIDGLLERMRLGLALIGGFAGISFLIAALTHRHIVGPLQRLEAVAATVEETKDYGLRAEYTSRDEIGRVTAAFNDMLAELAAARERETAKRAEFARVTRLTTMGEMAASIAHEINQPLAAIVAGGNAGVRLLANDTPDLNRVQTILRRVVRDGTRASEVVGSVRAMFRKEMQKKASLDLNDLVTDVLAQLHGELQSERIAVQVKLGDGLPPVPADRVQLQQVFVNLMTNAIDAMRSAGDRPRRLRVEARVVEADGVLITVGDTGPAIDPKLADRIFEPFFTTKPGGMGLGLSICRSIIEAHGGRVWVSPNNPEGTDFRFVLPCDDVEGGSSA
jgi:signal transduction histidine kinase